MTTTFEYQHVEGGVPIKMWTRGVPVDEKARDQLSRAAKMPFVFKHVAVMPDVHVGIGATVGSVIPTRGAVIPAAVGVDIGCGMMAARTSLMAHDLPDTLEGIRSAIERAVPHGRTSGRGGRGDKGAWGDPQAHIVEAWSTLAARFKRITDKYPRLEKTNNLVHLGTLGTGNHFIELCLDEAARVWVMLHSGSRGVGNAIGTFFIELAKQDMRKWHIKGKRARSHAADAIASGQTKLVPKGSVSTCASPRATAITRSLIRAPERLKPCARAIRSTSNVSRIGASGATTWRIMSRSTGA